QLLTRRIGIVGRYKYLDVEDDILPTSDRFENRAELEFRYIGPGGLSFGIAQGWRDLNLHNRARSEETAWYTDADISYLLPGRLGTLRIEARNLFDDSFNWVTDRFTLDGRVPDSQVIGTIEINF
ncbi:MAG: hypothetical protein HKO62_02480, partial [Gammaproteobacteria bacterium]|nr:hypothetical protein [Gammaproteobacteria bacterium]